MLSYDFKVSTQFVYPICLPSNSLLHREDGMSLTSIFLPWVLITSSTFATATDKSLDAFGGILCSLIGSRQSFHHLQPGKVS